VVKRLMHLDAVWGCEWGQSTDGCIRWGMWRSSKWKGQFGGKCGASRSNQWAFYAVRGGDAALPKLLLEFLF